MKTFVAQLLLLAGSVVAAEQPDAIRSYCLDFNWGKRGFAKPGQFADVNPEAFVAWHKQMNVNVIQTFCVSTNGYAWYKSDVVPPQPKLKHDFLRDVVKLGHKEGMLVMGYFCIGANTRWGKENPEVSYGSPSKYHIPYTDDYLAYLDAAIRDAVTTTGIDGFMIDWLWQPKRANGQDDPKAPWLDAEKKLYKQLMGKDFPGEEKLSQADYLVYSRKSIDRCWQTIKKAAKESNPDCTIWLTVNKIEHPHVINSDMYKEVDWLMNEAGSLEAIENVRHMVTPKTKLITCFAAWNAADPRKLVPEAKKRGIGLYGFGRPMGNGLIKLEPLFTRQITEGLGNSQNVAALGRAYNGASLDAMWEDGRFVEPTTAYALRLKIAGGRDGRSVTGKIERGDGRYLIDLTSWHGAGAATLTLEQGQQWPKALTLRMRHHPAQDSKFRMIRMTNGKTALAASVVDDRKAVKGLYGAADAPSTKAWDKRNITFMDPKTAAPTRSLVIRTGEDFVELDVPLDLLADQPERLQFRWYDDSAPQLGVTH